MGVNRGKQFEDKIKEGFERVKDTSVIRLYDVMTGYEGICNPCDFIVYHYPIMYMIECKSIHNNTLNFKSDIRKNQWDELLKYSKINGVVAGYMVWFIDKDKTIFVSSQELLNLHNNGEKSLNINKLPNHIVIEGVKKRVFIECDYRCLKDLEEGC